ALKELPPGVVVSLRMFSHNDKKDTDELLWLARRWDKDDLKDVDKKVDNLRDYGPSWGTPLVKTMIKAAKEDFPRGFFGTKYMLVLTDGGDSEYPNDGSMKRDLLEAFSNSAISLNVIGFEANDLSDDEARNAKLLKPIIEHDLQGKYQNAEANSLTD